MTATSRRILATLPRLRREAEALMASAVWRVERNTGESELVGYEPAPVRELLYRGPAKLQTYEGHERAVGVGTSTVVEQRSSLHFPVGSFLSKPGDLATCEESLDPLLIGRQVRLTQTYPVKEYATAYRVFVDEVV